MSSYCPPFVPVAEYLPAWEGDEWEVEHFEIDEDEVEHRKMMSVFSFSYGDYYDLEPGKYARLIKQMGSIGMNTTMTDTPMERRTNQEVVDRAHGGVLIGGLGLGMIVVPIMRKPEVERVLVVELSGELIEYVGSHVKKLEGGEKLEIVEADALEFWTDEVFNVVYFDIWNALCADNGDEMGKLHRRWTHRLIKEDPTHWMSSWRKEEVHYLRRQGGWR